MDSVKAQLTVDRMPGVDVSTSLHKASQLTSVGKKDAVGRQDLTCKLYTECDQTSSKLGDAADTGALMQRPVFSMVAAITTIRRNLLSGNYRTFQV